MTQTQSIHKGINSAQLRIATPTREVNTAKMQANAGAVNAGLSEEERAAKGLRSLDPVNRQLKVWQDFNQDGDNTSYKTIGGRNQAVQDERVGNYSQKRSGLCPYDGDNGVKNLKDLKPENQIDQQPKPARACVGLGRRKNPILQRKKWQCHRHIVISRYQKCSILRQVSNALEIGGRL